MSPEMVIYFLLLLIELICQTAASANRLSDIYWNSTNPIGGKKMIAAKSARLPFAPFLFFFLANKFFLLLSFVVIFI
ncbi:hypothetical protein GHT06_018014 [Daphnia sinensis]|uniref:Uncharacterized protein n=1 Tax=Daphnia sinensis TaxID=1820382 RepID=A0AAD5KLX2_9CRUS|nr:hypothetical protein GHT06_018014 [Daphnia sinensis]